MVYKSDELYWIKEMHRAIREGNEKWFLTCPDKILWDIANNKYFGGETPLGVCASMRGKVPPVIIDSLLSHGAYLNEVNSNQRTPIMIAVLHQNPEFIKYLYERQQKEWNPWRRRHLHLEATDSNGYTALKHAVLYDQQGDCIRALIKLGAKISNKEGSAFFWALSDECKNKTSSVKTLIEAISDYRGEQELHEVINQVDDYNDTILTSPQYLRNMNLKIFENIVQNGSNINHQNIFGVTPTLNVLMSYKPDLIKYLDVLLRYDADLTKCTFGKQEYLGYRQEYKHLSHIMPWKSQGVLDIAKHIPDLKEREKVEEMLRTKMNLQPTHVAMCSAPVIFKKREQQEYTKE